MAVTEISTNAVPTEPNTGRVKEAIDILLKDYDAARTEIRAAEARHEKVSFWLSSGLLAATTACFEKFKIGFAFIPMVILAYYAHRIYNHTLHIATLSQWIMRIEELVDKLLGTRGLLDWERTFVRQTLKSYSASSIASPHYITEGFILLPSIIVFAISVIYGPEPVSQTFGVSIVFARMLIWGGYPLLLVILCSLFFAIGDTRRLEETRKASVEQTYASLIK